MTGKCRRSATISWWTSLWPGESYGSLTRTRRESGRTHDSTLRCRSQRNAGPRGAAGKAGASSRPSVALVVLEPDEPVETVTVDDLPVGCAPWPRLEVVHDPATLGETGKPVAQSRGSGSTKQGKHHAFGSEWRLVAGHVGAKQRDGSLGEVAVGNGIRRTIGPVELREGVQLNCTAKDFTVERQGFMSGAREMEVGRRAGHASNVCTVSPVRADIGTVAGLDTVHRLRQMRKFGCSFVRAAPER